MAGRPINEALALARVLGDKTYVGSLHEICGTSERYTSNGACVQCAREKQQAQRDALVAQQQHEE